MMKRDIALSAMVVCVATVVGLLDVSESAADVIYLKNGNVIRGTVVEQNETIVKVKLGSVGEMTFARRDVHAIETNELDYKPLGTQAGSTAAAAAATTESPSDDGHVAEQPTPVETEPLSEADETVLAENLAKLRTDDPAGWQAAEDALAQMGPKVFSRLEQALGAAQKPAEAAVLMSTMSRIDKKRALAPIAAKATDTSEITRQAAVIMLGEIGDRRGTDTLIQCLADKKYFVRRDAADALGRIGDRKALPVLVRAVRDNDPEVQQAAMAALRKITKLEFSTGKEWQQWWDTQSAGTTQ